ncbi:hypothetical protein HU200_033386 [Digitaria exilis]|uniref:Uncharacterized protein n=1 Tax=Digitaria exilis TaxID=1010633 RepID=A0A835EL01_9POAL|nr:hypothetical protein HU200_033386 [Digitaria exilis]
MAAMSRTSGHLSPQAARATTRAATPAEKSYVFRTHTAPTQNRRRQPRSATGAGAAAATSPTATGMDGALSRALFDFSVPRLFVFQRACMYKSTVYRFVYLMARKRAADFVNLESGGESDDADTESQDFSDSQPFSQSEGGPYAAYSYGYDDPNESIKRAAYVQVLKDLAEIKTLKRKLAMSLRHKVIYLDFVNFGGRQVHDDIPRIAVWKGEMLKEYSSFDMKSTGSYGCHPLLDISATCYSKLDSYSGCKLPVVLKEKICSLIETFCFNPRLAVNVDVNSINGLPDELKKSFCNLLNYVSNINSRTPKLILDLVKLFADSADTEDPNILRSPEVTPSNEHIPTSVNNNFDFSEPKDFDNIEENGSHGVFCSQYELHKSFHSSSHLNVDPQKLSRNDLSSQFPSSSTPSRLKTQSPGLQSNCKENDSPSLFQNANSEVQIVGEKTLSDKVREMSNKSDALYNSNLRNSGSSAATPVVLSPQGPSASRPCTQSVSFRARDNSTGGKMPRYGPHRLLNPGPLFQGDFCTASNKISVSKSQIDNYKAICKLSSSQFQGEDAVYLYGVRCTFWALGESLKPGGAVKSYVISVFCYSLFQKPNGHPDISKRHYFFPNIAENLLKDPEFADEDVLSHAFRRSSKARPLHLSNMRSAFEFYWQKFIQFDIGFDEYEFIFPVVPQQPLDNTVSFLFQLSIIHY